MTPWPNNARAAITLTFDNMGEAADLNRNLWPSIAPIGSHYSVTEVLPQFLALARKYDIKVTYFAESWNLGVYPHAIERIAREGHEVGWHAWQHERWGTECADAEVERGLFERSFQAMGKFVTERGAGDGGVETYRGFRPPGGSIHGERTLRVCREFGLGYISPAAEEGALVPIDGGKDAIVVLPFRWRTVDAYYYYMDSFTSLRLKKGELPSEPQSPDVLVEKFIAQIDEKIEKGGFVSFLFHPFLNNTPERLEAMQTVLRHLAKRRDEGQIWLAMCRDVEAWVREHPDSLGEDPRWDDSTWS